jgi:hypothetical protein
MDLGRESVHSQSVKLGKLLAEKQDLCIDAYVIKKGKFVSGNQYWYLDKIEDGK